MAKVSPTNFLYIMCFDTIKKKVKIFGYTLTGILFAKSDPGIYHNINFLNSGNIVTLSNFQEILILNGYNLKRVPNKDSIIKIEEGSTWLEFTHNIYNKQYKNNFFAFYVTEDKKGDNSTIFYKEINNYTI